MNITFLLGNGFDVGLGLKSRFKDFFPIYVEKSKNKKEEIRKLSEKIGSDYDTWADFEVQMGIYTNEFDQSNKSLYTQQFRDFETEFIKYLQNEEQKLSFDEHDKIAKMIVSGLSDFYSITNLRPGSNIAISNVFTSNRGQEHKYNFLTFNYTGVLEKCLQTVDKGIIKQRKQGTTTLNDRIGKIVHAHGENNNAPIMGVNDASQIANKELANDERFIRYLVKPMLNSIHRTTQDADGASLISNSHIICIYGMALGPTDKRWWERILKWLNSGTERQLVIFDYDPNFSTSSQFDWIDKEDSIIDKLAEHISDTQIDLEKLRPRIHIAVHKNIFEMNLRKKETQINKPDNKKFIIEDGLIRANPRSFAELM